MNVFASAAISNAAMWLSVGVAIVLALFLTERIAVLWFFLIPMISGYTAKTGAKCDEPKEPAE